MWTVRVLDKLEFPYPRWHTPQAHKNTLGGLPTFGDGRSGTDPHVLPLECPRLAAGQHTFGARGPRPWRTRRHRVAGFGVHTGVVVLGPSTSRAGKWVILYDDGDVR